ncbi:MAG: c-type cytochrome [Acidobacteriota bacterium]
MKAAILVLLLAATTPTVQETNERLAQQVLKSIAGHENEPAEQVFMDIRIESLKKVPAAQFVSIMKGGYAKGLGVACTHCHVESDFSSDEKRPKRAAREMAAMHRTINQQLAGMKELESPKDERSISCSTCHRGSIDPVGSEQQ